jgi:hypothetical protein
MGRVFTVADLLIFLISNVSQDISAIYIDESVPYSAISLGSQFEVLDLISETADLISETADLSLQSLHHLLHVVSVLKEFPARLIPIGGPPTGLSVICTREGVSQHGLGDVVDFIVPCYPGATISDEVNIIIIIIML